MKGDLVAVILAGGKGNRFWPFSWDKSLFPFFDKPLITRSVVDRLPKDVTRVVVITNDTNNTVLSKIKYPVPSVTVVQPAARGMADAILSASSELQNSALFIMNADDVASVPFFHHVISLGQKENVFGAIAGFKTNHYLPLGYLVTDGTKITGISEKPGEGNEPSAYIGMLGHYIADGNILLEELKQTKSDGDDVYEKALSTLMKRNKFVFYPYKGDFASLKYPWHVLDVLQVLLETLPFHRGKNVEIKSNVVIDGTVYIDDDVRIFENTKIVGPCYIGKGAIIGNNNIIRASHIGAGCVTGFNTDITRSYVGGSCWFHTNYIGDSVLEENVSMGSGAVLANLRLDDQTIYSTINGEQVSSYSNKLGAFIGKNVRIGVNTSIMPGVKIGKDSLIGSGMLIDKDIPDESYCIIKPSYTILRNSKSVTNQDREEFKKKILQ
jgi:UDP-N-acetylglucosamine diphosphorylase / glucose-1-phosphate thymidylyltransferase / UDP-N-acetylgalactosamine diphosphorylase / glucosamine-1-phosphate N-acetyltransferase / galactosamine-1-phosphate N-acetyltransferase